METQLRFAIQFAGISTTNDVETKANEIMRIMHVKIPSGMLRKGEICRYILAIDLACRVLHVPYSVKKLMQLAAVSEPVYTQALRICRDMLPFGLKLGDATLDRLSVMFDGEHLRRDTHTILKLFKERYVDQLACAQRQHVDLSAPIYQSAAFAIAAKAKKVKLDRRALLDAVQVDPGLFKNVCNSILRVLTKVPPNTAPAPAPMANQENITVTNTRQLQAQPLAAIPRGVVDVDRRAVVPLARSIGTATPLNQLQSTSAPNINSIDSNSSSTSLLTSEDTECDAVTAGGRKPKRSLEEFEKMKEMIRNKRRQL